jgi:hypothetical protein
MTHNIILATVSEITSIQNNSGTHSKATYMRNCIGLLSSLILLGLSSACSFHYRTHTIIDTTKTNSMAWRRRDFGDFFTDGITRRQLINPYTYNPTGNGPPFYSQILTNTNDTTARKLRNELQNAIIRVANEEAANHIARIKSSENNLNLLLGSAQLGLSGGASVAGAATAKALAAASTGAGGARALVKEEIYRNSLGESIAALIMADQAAYLHNVIEISQKKSVLDYGVEQAITDAVEYNKRGSLFYGLSLARQAIEHQTSSVKTNTLGPK